MNKSPMRWILSQSRAAAAPLLCMTLASLATTAVSLLTTTILKAFTDYAAGTSPGSLQQLWLLSAVVIVAGGFFLILDAFCNRIAVARTERKIRTDLMHVLTRCDLLKLEGMHEGELITRLTSDAEAAAQCVPRLISSLLGGCLCAVAAFFYMLSLSWQLTLAITVAVPLLWLCIRLFSPVLDSRSRADKRSEETARSQMLDVLSSLPLIQVFRAQPFVMRRFLQQHHVKLQTSGKLGLCEGLFQFLNSTIGTLTFLLTMGLGAWLTVQGELTIGSMIAVINLLNHVTWPLTHISATFASTKQACVSAERVMTALSLPVRDPNPYAGAAPDALELHEITFAYAGTQPVFDGITLSLARGEITGIYGASGSGKSTLLKVLLGLYSPIQGCILPANLKAAYVPSDHPLYAGTLRENLLMGAAEDSQRLQKCIRLSHLQDCIAGLSRGLDTPVGSGGQMLSSGQAQRVAIARALYRDAHLLVLDEPTSNLDQASIAVLKETLRIAAQDRIVVVVSHDETLQAVCNRVFRLEDGQLHLQKGTA